MGNNGQGKSSTRLDRIEDKIDKLSDEIVSLMKELKKKL